MYLFAGQYIIFINHVILCAQFPSYVGTKNFVFGRSGKMIFKPIDF